MADIVVDTYKLVQYAQRIEAVNARIVRLDSRLDRLYTRVGLLDLWNLMQADLLTGYNQRLVQCRNYLQETAQSFEKTETEISFEKYITAKATSQALSNQISDYTDAAITNIINSISAAQITQEGLPEINNPADAFEWLDSVYDSWPREAQAVFNILVSELAPDSLEEAYKMASGIAQGDLTGEDIYEFFQYLFEDSTVGSVTVEAINYYMTTGQEIDAEMRNSINEQIKEGDFLGAIMEVAEGFVDGVIGGSVECLFAVGGTEIDKKIGEIPIVGSIIDEGCKYLTGRITGGEEYSLGDLVGLAGKGLGSAIDGATDGITKATDYVTSGVTSFGKKAVSWLGGLFD